MLRNRLDALRPKRWDYLFLDCPPSVGFLSVAALIATKEVLVPVEASSMAMAGVASLITTLDKVRERLNPGLKLYGVLPLPGGYAYPHRPRRRGLTREALRKGCLQDTNPRNRAPQGSLVARPTGNDLRSKKRGSSRFPQPGQTRSCSAIKEASKHDPEKPNGPGRRSARCAPNGHHTSPLKRKTASC